jgi:hypothetical protein
MTDTNSAATPRDRSPAYPAIPLGAALERLTQFEAHFKRGLARPENVGAAWSIKTPAYASRVSAALRYFGLLEYQGAGKERHMAISEIGRKLLRTQQEDTKREIVRDLALRPKVMMLFWEKWGSDRPADAACLDEMTHSNGFSDVGAREFLKVYDATISYAGFSASDKTRAPENYQRNSDPEAGGNGDHDGAKEPTPSALPLPKGVRTMAGERELTTGLLSKDASFRLIVAGSIGVKEIERLIKKLEIDKEILADITDDPEPPE